MRAFHPSKPSFGSGIPKIEQIGGLNDYPWNEYAGGTVLIKSSPPQFVETGFMLEWGGG